MFQPHHQVMESMKERGAESMNYRGMESLSNI